jgi:hypothetical protein
VTIELSRIPLSEFIRRVIERTGSGNWFGLAVTSSTHNIAEQIVDALRAETVTIVSSIACSQADALAGLILPTGFLIIELNDDWTADQWARMDILRSRLSRADTTILLFAESLTYGLFSGAPHLSSFFTGSVWRLADDGIEEITAKERAERIKSLEAWAEMSTEAMIKAATEKTLPSDPEFSEWLVLAGRGDLL